MNGGEGNDVLRGGAGNDILNGDAGNDILMAAPVTTRERGRRRRTGISLYDDGRGALGLTVDLRLGRHGARTSA